MYGLGRENIQWMKIEKYCKNRTLKCVLNCFSESNITKGLVTIEIFRYILN